MRTVCFLKNGSFDTKYGHERGDFSVKKRKKGHPIDLNGPKFSVVLTE